jgi:type IV pilus assembly protein PilW
MKINQIMCSRQAGFSLIELMISLTVGLIISGVVASVYVGNRQTYKDQEALQRMQENGRFALQIMARDIAGAGYRGCVPIGTAVTNLVATTYDSNFAVALYGNNGNAATWSPALNAAISGLATSPLAGTDYDVVTVRGSQAGSARTNAAPTATVLNIDAASLNGLVVGDYAELSRCDTTPASTIFKISAAAATTLTSSATGIPVTTPVGSEVKKMQTTTYYIGQTAGASTTSLYRQQGTAAPEEIVENVAGMQILYGVDTGIGSNNAAGDGVIDSYDTAATVDAVGALPAVATAGLPCAACTGWDRVRSVKINLLVVSADDNLATQSAGYVLDGFNYPADRRLKLGFTTVVTLRNRTL